MQNGSAFLFMLMSRFLINVKKKSFYYTSQIFLSLLMFFPVELIIKINKIMTTRLFKKKKDVSLIKVMWKSSTLSCKIIMVNAIEFLIMLRVKYCFTQNFKGTALKICNFILFSRSEEEGYVVLPLCVCLFVTNIYVAFFLSRS